MSKDNKKQINIPKFKSEDAERKFWSSVDLSELYSAADFQDASFPNLKPSTRSVSVRMPEYLLTRLKEQANKISIPYQTLLKQYVAKGTLGL